MKKDFNKPPLLIFLSYFQPHWRLYAIDMTCAVTVSVIDLIFPFVSRTAMQRLLPERMFAAFFAVVGTMLAAYVLKGLLYYVITVVAHGVGVLVEADMRSDVFAHMQTLSFSFFDHNRTGALLSRVTYHGACPSWPGEYHYLHGDACWRSGCHVHNPLGAGADAVGNSAAMPVVYFLAAYPHEAGKSGTAEKDCRDQRDD